MKAIVLGKELHGENFRELFHVEGEDIKTLKTECLDYIKIHRADCSGTEYKIKVDGEEIDTAIRRAERVSSIASLEARITVLENKGVI